MSNYAIVIGIKDIFLNKNEKEYLKKYKPAGVILFKRNISSKTQILSLVKELKLLLGPKAIIMIDQEGGKVSRLDERYWPTYPPANYFGELAKKNLKKAKIKTFDNYFSIGKELRKIGINYNCAPVLDLFIKNTNDIIGNRAFSKDPKVVSKLGLEACRGLIKARVKPVIKHIPGHGRSLVDSHFKLPVVDTSMINLEKDFFPFKELKHINSAMTAHIKYKNLDKDNSATHSRFIINEIIRKKIGFRGVLFSDDLCMKALQGGYFYRAKKAIEAGCDIVLHCEPDIEKIVKSTLGAGKMSKELKTKLTNSI